MYRRRSSLMGMFWHLAAIHGQCVHWDFRRCRIETEGGEGRGGDTCLRPAIRVTDREYVQDFGDYLSNVLPSA